MMVSAGRRALARFLDGAEHELLEEDFQHGDLGYAITVHKAQGSQFKRVMVPVTPSRLLDRTLILHGLDTGIEQVVFIGTGTRWSGRSWRRLIRTIARLASQCEHPGRSIREPRLHLMDRLHRQPRLVGEDPQQRSCRPGWTTPVLFPVL